MTGADQKRNILEPSDVFDGGELVYVHPDGAVAVYEGEPWFYPIGKLMSEAEVLTEDVNPKVFTIYTELKAANADDDKAEKD